MNKRVFKIRLIAWILCCICLVTMIPTSAMAFETERLQTTETVESTETISAETETQLGTETTDITIEETETANTTEEDDVETVALETETLETELTTEEAETETSETTETEAVQETSEVETATTETEAVQETSEAETETTEENVETETSETETTEEVDEAISLYEELMLADTCEQMYKLLQAEENKDAVLMLTVDELTSLQTRANAMEDDGWKEDVLEVLDMLIAIANGEGDGDTPTTFPSWPSQGNEIYEATIKNTLENVIVRYASYKKGVTNPAWTWSEEFTTDDTLELKYKTTSGTTEEYYVFFVKPVKNYLLKTFTITNEDGTSNYDLYSIDITEWDKVNIRVYPDIQNLIKVAKEAGYAYVGFNGYRGSAVKSNVTLTQNFKAAQPSLEVSATAKPSKDVKPGEKVEFTINVKPQLLDENDKVTELKVTLLKINDTEYEDVTLTQNADGTYTAVVDYVATDEDWRAGKIELTVNAEVTYKYVLPVKDRDGDESKITTTSVIQNSGTAVCLFSKGYGVSYKLEYKPENITVPDTIPTQPKDENRYYEGQMVTVKDYNRTSIDDPKNGGTWEFSGWEYGDKKDYQVEDQISMPEGGLELVGTWKFVPYPNLTIKKTVSGNMQDPEEKFEFTIRADKDMTYSKVDEDGKVTKVTSNEIEIDLGKDQEVTISVPIGATVTVSENASGYTYSIVKEETTIGSWKDVENGIEFTMPDKGSTVVFNNDKSITLDTGIVLDTLPYIVILILVAGGAVLLFKKRQDREDD